MPEVVRVAAVFWSLENGSLPPEIKAHVPAEILPYLMRAAAGDAKARAVLVAWIESRGDRTVWH